MVPLGDGSFGLLPEEWLEQYGRWPSSGTPEGGAPAVPRGRRPALLDALLAAQPEVACDEAFARRARASCARFAGRRAARTPPAGFVGTLRGYQREGLGWLHFLREFGFGGCLADDMGLGKTVQVLALLEARRAARGARRARPRRRWSSCRGRWSSTGSEEAARFTPQLRVLDHTGTGRATRPASTSTTTTWS